MDMQLQSKQDRYKERKEEGERDREINIQSHAPLYMNFFIILYHIAIHERDNIYLTELE